MFDKLSVYDKRIIVRDAVKKSMELFEFPVKNNSLLWAFVEEIYPLYNEHNYKNFIVDVIIKMKQLVEHGFADDPHNLEHVVCANCGSKSLEIDKISNEVGDVLQSYLIVDYVCRTCVYEGTIVFNLEIDSQV